MLARIQLAAVIGLLAVSSPGLADDGAEPDRYTLHWGLGLGGYFALAGPSTRGVTGHAELIPGGWFGRLGVRAGYVRLGDGQGGLITFGGVFDAASARPHLLIQIHGGGVVAHGATDIAGGAGGGALVQLGIVGPLAFAIDGGAYLLFGGDTPELYLGSAVVVRLSR